ncbi:multidrug efflux system protein [Legionella santicrucis]|uniref:Multidrug efflux system protein n=1 Tax=Legionella santicrucis TaxID=45074 RepID=A0A0W0ZEL5_9GAMM|nr:DHA2 family efflux MFS transporter permease subunit [Legionella santicrucis]KTD67631.1 multidrug efflux system protein [Legionella santicrucis]
MNNFSTTTLSRESIPYKAITFSVMLATIMQSLDSTIANVALPHMQGSLATTQDQMSWVLTSYIVAAAIAIPLTGWLAGYLGRKLVFLTSIAGFTFSSILCGIAGSLPEMVIFRLMQGVFGAALVPLSQSILFDINSKENFGKAMALWGVGVTLGPILGPALGGWLTENYNWRWVFYINVPIGILSFIGLYFFLSETKAQKSRFDFMGFITLSIGVSALQLMLDRGELKDWFSSPEIILETIISGLGFYLFLIHSITYKTPFINLEIFKDRNFVAGNVLIFVLGIVLFATLALIPPLLQNQLNYPVITAGIVTAPRGVGTMVAMILVGKIINQVDPRFLVGAGLLTTAFSLWGMTSYSLYIDSWAIIWVGVVQGFGIGLAYVALSTLTFSTLLGDLRNEGTSLFNLMRNIGSSIGISIVTSLLTSNTQINHGVLASHITPYNIAANPAYFANHIDVSTQTGLVSLNYMLTNQATMIAYIDDFKLMMLITLGVLPLLCFIKKPKDKVEHSIAVD